MTENMSFFKELTEKYEWPKAVAVTGALGCGKTEWVLNLALGFKTIFRKVTIADVDIINPYFCIRQVSETLESQGYKVLMAPDKTKWSDMPIITAQVDWALSEQDSQLLLDIGGDSIGARALKQYERRIKNAGYLLIMVVNAFRPHTADLAGIEKMLKRMEAISDLKVGALISNSHLMSETTLDQVMEGLEIVRYAASRLELPLLYAGIPPGLSKEAAEQWSDPVPYWPVSRYMLLPWEKGALWSTGLPSKNHGTTILNQLRSR
ncbi:MAG: hypothetical protein JW971_04095 [Synergistales bacterium]|nr:hypothetical protein [Synergistales bacterium]